MNELLMCVIMLACTCLLLLLRSLLGRGRLPQKKYLRGYFWQLDNINGDAGDADAPDEWPFVIGGEAVSPQDEKTAEARRSELAVMQERIFRLLP